MMKKIILIITVFVLSTACSSPNQFFREVEYNSPIGTMPINFQSDLELKELLLLENSRERTDEITHIVLHFISNVIAKPNDPYKIEDVHQILFDNGVSAHYIIDRDGMIYLAIPEDRVALRFMPEVDFLSIFLFIPALNPHSIGIEMMSIGTKEEMTDFI